MATMMKDGQRAHDVGGQNVTGPIDREDHPRELWEKEIEALWRLMSRHCGVQADELRRGIEDLGAGQYERLGYFERWAASLTQIAIERGIVSIDSLARKLAEIESPPPGAEPR
jgi:hypothetical protein